MVILVGFGRGKFGMGSIYVAVKSQGIITNDKMIFK